MEVQPGDSLHFHCEEPACHQLMAFLRGSHIFPAWPRGLFLWSSLAVPAAGKRKEKDEGVVPSFRQTGEMGMGQD